MYVVTFNSGSGAPIFMQPLGIGYTSTTFDLRKARKFKTVSDAARWLAQHVADVTMKTTTPEVPPRKPSGDWFRAWQIRRVVEEVSLRSEEV